MVHSALKEGRDYGVIPGTGDKPTMLKPGAERVALAFGCYYGEPEIIEKEVDHDREVRWKKTKWVIRPKPEGWKEIKEAGLGRNRKLDDNKWVWQEREEESGTSLGLYRYVLKVPVISRETGEVVGSGIGSCSSLETKYIDRPRDTENTILKMAHKRAMVAACLVTFGLSDEFTQDVEDLAQFTGEGEQSHPPRSPASNRTGRAPQRSTPAATASAPTADASIVRATDDQKRRIRTLLAQADIDDETRAGIEEKILKNPNVGAVRAEECIAFLEKASGVAKAVAEQGKASGAPEMDDARAMATLQEDDTDDLPF